MEIFLDKFMSERDLHIELKEKLGFPDYYGGNLDALNDCLDEIETLDVDIYISDENIENKTIDDIIHIFEERAGKSSDFSFRIHQEEFLNIMDKNENITNNTKPRSLVHRDGDLHMTAHIWIIKRIDTSLYVLLQKRSKSKLLYSGLYDVSSAGHISAGEEARYSAVRELEEELGIKADPRNLEYIGNDKAESTFITPDGKQITDREITTIYVYNKHIDIDSLKLQESEVESVCWFDVDECIARIDDESFPNCIRLSELKKLKKKIL
ncbi:MAG: NUDIX domain-containing protein [Oscillospiraceae bacterium]|nr:NUDIX domain-containing protein [Oscillospiraceae bacterium]